MVALQYDHCMEQQAACLRAAVDAWWWMVRMEEAREESGALSELLRSAEPVG